MALITNFTTLVAAIKDRANRTDMADADAEGFIQQGEARLNRLLRMKDMEILGTVTTNASGIAAYPTGFLEAITVYDSTNALVQPVNADRLVTVQASSPKVYALLAGSIYLAPAAAETLSVLYYQKITALTSSNLTNWLCTAHPDVYLYASLWAYAVWQENDADTAKWDGFLGRTIAEIQTADAYRHARGPTPMDSDFFFNRYRNY